MTLGVEGGRQQRDGGGLARATHRRAPVLVVQVEAQRGLEPITQCLEDTALGGLERQGIAVDIQVLRVVALEALGTIRIEQGQHVQAKGGEQPGHPGMALVAAHVLEQAEERRGRGGLIAVHL